ncbi:MAG: NADH-quinone oxidoreductase subunit C [Deltaproteobacteria bacterium]|nr:NADH-quinone oxidoreductase subunit C [Deltaproteobacteria bacterium]
MKDSVYIITEDNTPVLSPDRIITQTRILKDEGFRFITMSSTDLGESICVLYHLDKDLQLVNLKVEVPKGSKIPSICSVYASAVLIENEIKEHFGVEFDGLSLDFQGMLYLDEEVQKTPFCKIGITRV